jgi:uncharacterized RDD family membrane protein YckC
MKVRNEIMDNAQLPVVTVYASIGRRFLALLLDAAILCIPFAIMNHVIPFGGSLLVWFLYAPLLESSEVQATIGKHLMGIQVTDIAGGRISFKTALIRSFLKTISSLFLCLGYVIAFFTERKQTFHDLLAETVVVYGRNERPIADAWIESGKEVFRQTGVTSRNVALAELEQLQALREKGVLTEEEFQAQKSKILAKL